MWQLKFVIVLRICQCHVMRNFSSSFVCNSVIQQLVLLMICVNIMWYLDTGNSFLLTCKKQVILVNIRTDWTLCSICTCMVKQAVYSRWNYDSCHNCGVDSCDIWLLPGILMQGDLLCYVGSLVPRPLTHTEEWPGNSCLLTSILKQAPVPIPLASPLFFRGGSSSS